MKRKKGMWRCQRSAVVARQHVEKERVKGSRRFEVKACGEAYRHRMYKRFLPVLEVPPKSSVLHERENRIAVQIAELGSPWSVGDTESHCRPACLQEIELLPVKVAVKVELYQNWQNIPAVI